VLATWTGTSSQQIVFAEPNRISCLCAPPLDRTEAERRMPIQKVRPPGTFHSTHRHVADAFFQDELRGVAGDQALRREHPCCPHGGMAGKGQLAGGVKIRTRAALTGLPRRQHERGLREVHLLGDALHDIAGDVFGVEHHGQLVPSQCFFGEDVYGVDAMGGAQGRITRQVVVPCASSLPSSGSFNRPSAVAILPPR